MNTDEVFEPLARDSAAERIANQLRDAIVAGRLPAGQPLREIEIGRRLGMSRGPVREAFQRLIQEGLLEAKPAKGVFVLDLKPDDITDVYLARQAIECAAAQLLTGSRHSKEALDRLHAALDALQAVPVDDWQELSRRDLLFHEELVRATGSKRLIRMFGTLVAETRLCMTALEPSYPDHAAMITEHTDIVAAIDDQNASTAVRLVEYHMLDAARRLRSRMTHRSSSGKTSRSAKEPESDSA